MKPKLFVTIPSMLREMVYNSHTNEVYFQGKLYATIKNKNYTIIFPKKP